MCPSCRKKVLIQIKTEEVYLEARTLWCTHTQTVIRTCQYRYHKLLEQNLNGRSFEISPWSPRMGLRMSAASTSPRYHLQVRYSIRYAWCLPIKEKKYAEYQYNVVDHFTEQGSSRAMTKRHWEHIVHKNVRIPVQFIYYQIISLEISHENWIRWRHKSWKERFLLKVGNSWAIQSANLSHYFWEILSQTPDTGTTFFCQGSAGLNIISSIPSTKLVTKSPSTTEIMRPSPIGVADPSPGF